MISSLTIIIIIIIIIVLTSAKVVLHEALSHHHLPAAQHAPPPAVRRHLGAADGGKLTSVREPQAAGEVRVELVQRRHFVLMLLRGQHLQALVPLCTDTMCRELPINIYTETNSSH